jgi:hypothetical protein
MLVNARADLEGWDVQSMPHVMFCYIGHSISYTSVIVQIVAHYGVVCIPRWMLVIKVRCNLTMMLLLWY